MKSSVLRADAGPATSGRDPRLSVQRIRHLSFQQLRLRIVMPVLVTRLSGSANQVVFPPGNHPPESSCPCLSLTSTAMTTMEGLSTGGDSPALYRNANRTAVGQ